jgi:predicted nuclease of predicted toxin-antitoxin system
MRLLANENFPKRAVAALRALGHDVAWVAEVCPSTADANVLALAVRDARVLVTQDKDFGTLAFHHGLPATCGVILFRVPPVPDLVTQYATRVLGRDVDYRGRFVVVEEGRVRERDLPPGRTP